METSGQHHAAATLSSAKEPPVPTEDEGGWVGPRVTLNVVAKRKTPSPCRKSNPGLPVTILTYVLQSPYSYNSH